MSGFKSIASFGSPLLSSFGVHYFVYFCNSYDIFLLNSAVLWHFIKSLEINIKRSYVLLVRTRSSFSIYLLLFSCSELDISKKKTVQTVLCQNIPVILISQCLICNNDGHWPRPKKALILKKVCCWKFFSSAACSRGMKC